MSFSIKTEQHTDNSGLPSKRIVIDNDGDTIIIALGAEEARMLSAALKPNGRDIVIGHGKPIAIPFPMTEGGVQ